ncbi:MAG: hydrolase [delta proteobacterium MLS_D]|jgi:predicted hydrolase (HD superfamily)|nr:MAG: hydrolase [delta proteobacterium MLS_D]
MTNEQREKGGSGGTAGVPTREEALELLKQYNKNESLIAHALSVEAVMRHFALRYGGDPEEWGIIGLVHDLDYELYPELHCVKTREILEEHGWPEKYIRAVMSHGWGICTDVEPESDLEKVLYAIDELTGLITAAALVRPSRSLADLTVKSVKKKWKDKRFAAGVDRNIIERGAGMLNIEISDLIAETIEGMRKVAGQIGLEQHGES